MNKEPASVDNLEEKHIRKVTAMLLLAVAAFLLVLAPLASTNPDGLERAAQDLGLISGAPLWAGLLPGYETQAGGGWVSTVLAGAIGIILVFAIMCLVAKATTLRARA